MTPLKCQGGASLFNQYLICPRVLLEEPHQCVTRFAVPPSGATGVIDPIREHHSLSKFVLSQYVLVLSAIIIIRISARNCYQMLSRSYASHDIDQY